MSQNIHPFLAKWLHRVEIQNVGLWFIDVWFLFRFQQYLASIKRLPLHFQLYAVHFVIILAIIHVFAVVTKVRLKTTTLNCMPNVAATLQELRFIITLGTTIVFDRWLCLIFYQIYNFWGISDYANWPVILLTNWEANPIISKYVNVLRPSPNVLVIHLGSLGIQFTVKLWIKNVYFFVFLICVRVHKVDVKF